MEARPQAKKGQLLGGTAWLGGSFATTARQAPMPLEHSGNMLLMLLAHHGADTRDGEAPLTP